MAQSIVRFGPLANVIVFVGTLQNDAETKDANEIAKITQFHDFEFTSDGALARRQSSIGVGKKIKLRVMKQTPTFIIDQTYKDTILKNHTNDLGNPQKMSKLEYVFGSGLDDEQDVNDELQIPIENQNHEYESVFTCPNQFCNLEFLTQRGIYLEYCGQ